MLELISVIVPIYNAEEYLQQCIESIINQTYKLLEIILVNDGSTDNSLAICEWYKGKDERICIISQENSGSVLARKAGIKISKGKYIGFVDADDYIDENMFEELYHKLVEYDVDFVNSGMIIKNSKSVNYDSEIVDFSVVDREYYINHKFFDSSDMIFALWSKLFKADVIKSIFMKLPDEQCYGEDMLCMLNILLDCKRFYMYKQAFYHYRIQEESLSHGKWLDIILEESKLYEQVKKMLMSKKGIKKYGGYAKKHYKKRIMYALAQSGENGIIINKYIFESIDVLKDKRVVIYGAGKVGKDYYNQITKYNRCQVVAWVDKEILSSTDMLEIIKPEQLQDKEYDILIIAVKSEEIADSIRMELISKSYVKKEVEIVWQEPKCIQEDI